MQAKETIRIFLRRVRLAERVRLWSASFAVAAAGLGVSLLVSLSLMATTGPQEAWLGWFILSLGTLATLIATLFTAIRRHRALSDDVEVARWIESQRPMLSSSLVSAVELGRVSRAELVGSPMLAEETTLVAARAVATLDATRLGDPPGARRRVLQGLSAAAIAVAAFLAAPALWDLGWANLTHSAPAAERDGARWVDAAVSQIDVEIRPPPYTSLGTRRLPRGIGDISALVGSEVRLSTTSTLPDVARAALVLESSPDTRWEVDIDAPDTPAPALRGAFRVGADDRYQFTLLLRDGTVVRERAWRRVTATPDLPPEATLLLPESDLEVKPDDRIEFFFEASDDLGLGPIDLVVTGEDGSELLRTPARDATGSRLEKGSATVDVARLDLEPGDAVDVLFEARDLNDLDPEAGPGIGRSAPRRLTLYSPADEHERFLADLEAIMDALIDVLADRIESPLDASAADRWARVSPFVVKVVRDMSDLLGRLETLVRSFAADPMASPELRDGVRAIHDNLLAIHEQESAQVTRWQTDPRLTNIRVMVQLLDRLNRDGIREDEASILALKRLLDDARKASVMDIGRQILETQNEMMELLKKLKETDDPAAKEAALKKLKKLQQKMQQLQQELAKLQERTPYENQNPQQRPSDRQLEAADMKSTMERIEELLKEGKYDEAMALLEELNKSTQEMMAGLQEDLDAMGGRMSAAASRRQAEFMQELDAVADGQRGLQGETGAVGEGMEQRMADEAREQHAEALDAAREGARAMQQALEGAKGEGLHPDDARAIDALGKKARELEDALREGKLDRANQLSRELSEGIAEAQREVGESASREIDAERLDGLKESGGKLGEAGEASREISEKLGAMGAGQEPAPNSPERSRLDRLAQEQRALKERLDRMNEKLDELEGDQPGIKGELGPKLGEAAEKMNEAGNELGEGAPRDAENRQQEALERLREAQQAMKERMQRQKGSQPNGQEDGVGINDPNEKVGIPADDPYAAPRNLREEIMRAMQEDAPAAWKESIRRFYEELTR